MANRQLMQLNEFSGPLSARVYLVLKNAILSLSYRPGENMRKGEICEALGVSRSPVSEAITKLASEGLVEVVPQAGTFVSRFSMAEIREGAFLREALELAAVELVASSITQSQLEVLHRNLQVQQSMVDDGDIAGFYPFDQGMHNLILSFTGYNRLSQFADASWVQVDRARQLNLPSPGRLQETVDEHRKIIEALEAGEPKLARHAMRHHLRQLIKYLEPLELEHPELFEPS